MENITDTKFHGGKERHQADCARLMVNAVSDGRISKKDRDQIQAFISEVRACGKLSEQRAYKLSYQLVGLRKYIPEFSSVDTSSVFSGIERLKAEGNYTVTTQGDLIKLCKRFLLWLQESGESSDGLKIEKLKKIKAKTVASTKTADDILSPDQIEALFSCVTTTKNRAMIELLYESAGRAGEIATLTWGQVTFYQNYASVRLDGKTGKTRQAPLYTSHIVLRRWKDQYPGGNPDSNDLIFPARAGGSDPMSYTGMAKIVKIAAKTAGIEKPVTLHTFRHSRITHLLQAGMNESTIKLLAWGDLGSNMIRTYAHLVPGDVEAAFNQMYGIKSVEEFKGMDPALSPHQCPSCGMLNPPTNRYCGGCGAGLTPGAADEKAEALRRISQDEVIMNMLTKALNERDLSPSSP
nr:tyrosine-type recombinase/integrase [uncultured Methanospirillum sp.]